MKVAGVEIEFSDGIAMVALLVSVIAISLTEWRHRSQGREQKSAAFIYQHREGRSDDSAARSYFHNLGPHDAFSVVVDYVMPDGSKSPLSRNEKVAAGENIETIIGIPRSAQTTSEDWSSLYSLSYHDGLGHHEQLFHVSYSRNGFRLWMGTVTKVTRV